MQLEKYKILINDELQILEEYIEYIINQNIQHSGVKLSKVISYITAGKGKRIRSIILLLLVKSLKNNNKTSKAINNVKKDIGVPKFDNYIKLAALIELLHTATLLHDDVIDESQYRRNKFTVNYKWGNLSSIVAGDWLLSIIFQILVDINNKEILKIFSNAFNNLVSGELQQLKFVNNNKLSYEQYLQIITKKTAILFELATAIPAILSKSNNEILYHVKNYGFNLGLSFQMSDDILDYLGDPKIRGKNIGEDINNGKITLPVIELLKINPQYYKIYSSNHDIDKLLEILNSTGAIKNSIAITKMHCDAAIKNLEPINNSCYTEALTHIAESITSRLH